MSNQIDFRLRYQVREDTPLGKLFNYLKSKDTEFSPRQMVLSALNAFWYPLACKWSGSFEEDRLQSIARHAIYELQQQIKYLARAFGLEQELVDLEALYGIENSPEAPPAEEDHSDPLPVQNVRISDSNVPQPSAEGLDLPHGYEESDEMLNQMFK